MCSVCGDSDPRLIGLAYNRGAPPRILLSLLEAGPHDVRHALCCRTTMPDELVDALVSHPDRGVRGALTWNLSLTLETRSRLAADPERGVRGALVEHSGYRWRGPGAPLTVEAYELLAADPDPRVREEVALHPYTPPHVQALLAADPDPDVRLSVPDAWRWLSEETRAALTADADPKVREASWALAEKKPEREVPDAVPATADDPGPRFYPVMWVRDACGDAAEMRRCATSPRLALRRSAAFCPHLPPDLVRALADDDDFLVRLFLAENHPDPPGDLLLRTVLEFEGYSVTGMLRHPNFPRAGLRRFAGSSEPRERALVTMDPHVQAETVERLSHDPELTVRKAAAVDARLPVSRMLEMLADEETAEAAASNPGLPVETMDQIVARYGRSPGHRG